MSFFDTEHLSVDMHFHFVEQFVVHAFLYEMPRNVSFFCGAFQVAGGRYHNEKALTYKYE